MSATRRRGRGRRDENNNNDVEEFDEDQFEIDALSDNDVSVRLETAQLRRETLAIKLALLEVDQEVEMLEKRTSRQSGMSSVASSPSNPSAIRVQYVSRPAGQQQPLRGMNRTSTSTMDRVEEVMNGSNRGANRGMSRHHTSSSRSGYKSPDRSRSSQRSSRRPQHYRSTSKASRRRTPRRNRRTRQRNGYDSDSSNSADTLGSDDDSYGSNEDEYIDERDRRRRRGDRNNGSSSRSRNARRRRRERNATGKYSNFSNISNSSRSSRKSQLPRPPSPPPGERQQPLLALPPSEQETSDVGFEMLSSSSPNANARKGSNISTNTRNSTASLRMNTYRNPRTRKVESVVPQRKSNNRISMNDVDMKSVQRVSRKREDGMELLPHEALIEWASNKLGHTKSENVKWVWGMVTRDAKVIGALLQRYTRVLLVQFAPTKVVNVWDRCVSILTR